VFRKLTVEENIRRFSNCRTFPKRRSSPVFPGAARSQHRAPAAGRPRCRCRAESAAASRSPGPSRTRPSFILLDEPLRGRRSDRGTRTFQKIIRFLKERGIGILITDHNVRETLGIADHAYIINDGLVLAFGKPDEIVYNENVRRVYLGENFRL